MSVSGGQLRDAPARSERNGLRRNLRVISGEHGPRAIPCGRSLIMMSSNNYLGLAADPRVKDAAISAITRYGVGAGASRLVAGSLEPVHRLEAKLARLKGAEAALVFGSGYLANLRTLTALAGPGYAIFSDELNPPSLIARSRPAKTPRNIHPPWQVAHL